MKKIIFFNAIENDIREDEFEEHFEDSSIFQDTDILPDTNPIVKTKDVHFSQTHNHNLHENTNKFTSPLYTSEPPKIKSVIYYF